MWHNLQTKISKEMFPKAFFGANDGLCPSLPFLLQQQDGKTYLFIVILLWQFIEIQLRNFEKSCRSIPSSSLYIEFWEMCVVVVVLWL